MTAFPEAVIGFGYIRKVLRVYNLDVLPFKKTRFCVSMLAKHYKYLIVIIYLQ